jgi:hypothetical protein
MLQPFFCEGEGEAPIHAWHAIPPFLLKTCQKSIFLKKKEVSYVAYPELVPFFR